MATPPPLSPPATTRIIGNEIVRVTWIFQAGCALPTLFVLGTMAFFELFEPRISLYDFITDLSNSLFAAGIIFLVVIQRRVHLDALGQFCFEAMKALFATAMWLWLLLDALFAHTEDGPYYEEQRRRRIIRAWIASILLWILFYPLLAYLGWVWMKSRVQARDEEEEDGDMDAHFEEDMPLLGERG